MSKLRRLAGRDVLTILQGFGFQQVSQRGSHVKLIREVVEIRQVLTVPLHAELDPGTVRAIFRKPVDSSQNKTYARISIHKHEVARILIVVGALGLKLHAQAPRGRLPPPISRPNSRTTKRPAA